MVNAQSRVEYLLEESARDSNHYHKLELHSAVRPQVRQKDSVEGFTNKASSLFRIGVLPISDINFGAKNGFVYRLGTGVQTEMQYKTFFWRIAATAGVGSIDSVFQTNSYYWEAKKQNYIYTDVRTRLSYSPNSIFNFQIGLDQHFFGEGSRSLWLGDHTNANPFGQIKVNFWRIQYDIIYQFMRENYDGAWRGKFGTTHHLSVNATPWLNIGLFENVIFRPKAGDINRGFEIEYLNPVIFLRPQEYAVGSSDNVLVGASLSAKIKSHTLYGQFSLDEFNFAELRKNKSYWANKYGFQLGVKGHIKQQSLAHFYRAEFNSVRPYTYSHIDAMHAYGNQGRPLAHPNGANFHEVVLEYNLQWQKWNAGVFARYLMQGKDSANLSYGSDIYLPYMLRPDDYGHKTAQGIPANVAHLIVKAEYLLIPKIRLAVYIENHLQYKNENLQYWPVLGIRSRIWNDYRNY